MPDTLNGETLLYPILGDPVVFVKSPQRLTAKFAERGHNGICIPMQVRKGQLAHALLGLEAALNVRGLLITMPHKNAMFAHCATTSRTAKLLGVISVVRRNLDGSWHGDMLDGLSFVAALKKAGATLAGARVWQAGAGGAGSAIGLALLEAGVRELVVYDVDRPRCDQLVRLLAGTGNGSVIAGSADPNGCDIVVNATPLGMLSDDPLPVATHKLISSMFVGDVVAGHGVTPLLQAALAAGCKTTDGSQMVETGMDLMLKFMLNEDGCRNSFDRVTGT